MKSFIKRFCGIFIFCIVLGGLCQFCIYLGEVAPKWKWPRTISKVFMNCMEWLQDHPPFMALFICFVVALIGTLLSYTHLGERESQGKK